MMRLLPTVTNTSAMSFEFCGWIQYHVAAGQDLLWLALAFSVINRCDTFVVFLRKIYDAESLANVVPVQMTNAVRRLFFTLTFIVSGCWGEKNHGLHCYLDDTDYYKGKRPAASHFSLFYAIQWHLEPQRPIHTQSNDQSKPKSEISVKNFAWKKMKKTYAKLPFLLPFVTQTFRIFLPVHLCDIFAVPVSDESD